MLSFPHVVVPPPLIGGGIKRCFCLTSDVCLTPVAYIGPKSRTERPRNTNIGIDVAHVTRDSDTTFGVKRSKVKVTHKGGCSGQRGNVFGVGKYCNTLRLLGGARGAGAPTEGRGILCRHAHSLFS